MGTAGRRRYRRSHPHHKTLREHRIEAVIHLAAHCYVGESVENPAKYFRNNVTQTLTMLEAMAEVGVKSIVFSSSCATYGIPEIVPITESEKQLPVNPYGESKLMVERMLQWFGVAHKLQWMALRYFNAAGADPDGEIGEAHAPETHLLPLVLEAASRKRNAVSIFGSDYPTPDGTAVRDYVHVTDLADAHVRALAFLQSGGASQGLNVGSGTGYSVKEVIAAAERVTGASIPSRLQGRRAGDPPILLAGGKKIREVLGWTPHHSDLDTILGTAWCWHVSGKAAGA
jgi:UDP-glucose-4-epimerase GalE